MTNASSATVALMILATDPPFDADHDVLFGLQARREVDDPVPASESTEFRTEIEVRTDSSGVDFEGDHVHGRRGDRFIYLSWGLPDQTQPFVMFARAKIKLGHIPPDVLNRSIEQHRRLRAELRTTDARGHPVSGTIGPSAIRWTID